jgi:hypothetical protein
MAAAAPEIGPLPTGLLPGMAPRITVRLARPARVRT